MSTNERRLMEGSEAIAEAAIAAGCVLDISMALLTALATCTRDSDGISPAMAIMLHSAPAAITIATGRIPPCRCQIIPCQRVSPIMMAASRAKANARPPVTPP